MGSRPGVEARADRLSDPGPTETEYQGRRPLGAGHRLGCAARIVEDVVIDVPADSQVHRQVVRKRAGVAALPVDPVVRLHYVEVAEPDLASPTGDLERLLVALENEWGLSGLVVDPPVLQRSPDDTPIGELGGDRGGASCQGSDWDLAWLP